MTWAERTRPPHTRLEVFGMLCTTIDNARQDGELDTYDALEFCATVAWAVGMACAPTCEVALVHLLRPTSERSPLTDEGLAQIGADIYFSRWEYLETVTA